MGLTSLATITKAMSAEGSERGRRQWEWRGATVLWVDGDVADGIRPSHCRGPTYCILTLTLPLLWP